MHTYMYTHTRTYIYVCIKETEAGNSCLKSTTRNQRYYLLFTKMNLLYNSEMGFPVRPSQSCRLNPKLNLELFGPISPDIISISLSLSLSLYIYNSSRWVIKRSLKATDIAEAAGRPLAALARAARAHLLRGHQ